MVQATCDDTIRFKILELNQNQFVDDESCFTLKDLLVDMTPIMTLSLNETSITAKGLSILLEAAEKNTHISHISVKGCGELMLNNNHSQFYRSVKESLEKNCSLLTLDYDLSVRVDEKMAEVIKEQLAQNKNIVEIIFPKVMEQEVKAI